MLWVPVCPFDEPVLPCIHRYWPTHVVYASQRCRQVKSYYAFLALIVVVVGVGRAGKVSRFSDEETLEGLSLTIVCNREVRCDATSTSLVSTSLCRLWIFLIITFSCYQQIITHKELIFILQIDIFVLKVSLESCLAHVSAPSALAVLWFGQWKGDSEWHSCSYTTILELAVQLWPLFEVLLPNGGNHHS